MKLYHYTTGRGLFGILNSGQLHCTNMKFLNDPSEGTYFSDIIKAAKGSSEKVTKIFDKLFQKSYLQTFGNPNDLYVASFSKNGYSLSMWNYYAQGNGYNFEIEFDPRNVPVNNRGYDLSVQCVELIYDKEVQVQALCELVLSKEEDYEKFLRMEREGPPSGHHEIWGINQSRMDNIDFDFNENLMRLLLSFKHPAYEREEEVRLIIAESDFIPAEKSLLDYRVSTSGVFVDFLKLNLGLTQCLKSVTVHPLNQGTIYSEGVGKYMKSRFPGVKIIQSKIPFRVV